ncbi:unnamed protein product, partial [Coregonus sp. 'balchen']
LLTLPCYSAHDYTCCEGVLHKGAGLSCCGNKAFNLTQASCCEGQLTLNVSQLVSDCCGWRAYDPLNQLCCDTRILIRTQPHDKCCGKELYNEDDQLCCGNVGRKVLTKMSIHHLCCGDHQFDCQSHCCCFDSERLSPEHLNASCCASSGFNRNCSEFTKLVSMPGEKPCGQGACFNPTTEGCCVNPTSLQGQRYSHHLTCCEGTLSHTPGLHDGASCGSQVYNPEIKICCAGQLSNRVLGDNLCCGKTPYGVVDRGVLCCNQTLHRGVEDGHRCSPGGHLYLPSREMAYDPSSGKVKCCAGTLYNLQVQDRLSEETHCCGNVLMEAGSTQTCCSAPGLDLLYPTQPGFTCCGHRYPNSSLWSCCAGVLHPRPESHTTSKNMIPGPRLLPLGGLKTEDLCHTRGTVESVSVKMNKRSIVMVNTMFMQASRGHVSALPSPHYLTLPDHCSFPELGESTEDGKAVLLADTVYSLSSGHASLSDRERRVGGKGGKGCGERRTGEYNNIEERVGGGGGVD